VQNLKMPFSEWKVENLPFSSSMNSSFLCQAGVEVFYFNIIETKSILRAMQNFRRQG